MISASSLQVLSMSAPQQFPFPSELPSSHAAGDGGGGRCRQRRRRRGAVVDGSEEQDGVVQPLARQPRRGAAGSSDNHASFGGAGGDHDHAGEDDGGQGQGEPVPEDECAVAAGARVQVYWTAMRTWYEGVVRDVFPEWDSQGRARWVVHIAYIDIGDGDDEDYYHYFDHHREGVKWRQMS